MGYLYNWDVEDNTNCVPIIRSAYNEFKNKSHIPPDEVLKFIEKFLGF